MNCDCQRNLCDCEDSVRRFLKSGQSDGSFDLAARDELIMRMKPFVERIVNGALQGYWRSEREIAIQETYLKLCNPAKVRTWLEQPKQKWFCRWVMGVAYRTAIDQIRRRTYPESIDSVDHASPRLTSQEHPEAIRKTILATISEFEIEQQLAFVMKFSYFVPSIADIKQAVNKSPRTVFGWLDQIKNQVRRRCAQYLSAGVENQLVGTLHPVTGFDRLQDSRQDQINEAIVNMLMPRPLKEQLAFYMKYSPLAASLDEIVAHVKEDLNTVRGWLALLESEIERMVLVNEH